MSSVDNRIVKMTFDNQKFEEGVKTTMDSIENLKKGLDFSGIQTGIESLQKRFSTMGIVGMEITRKITDGIISSAKKLSDSTIGQIKQGGKTRALNIEQARFQLQGLFSDMKDGDKQVDKVMTSALNAVKGTAYGLDEAAKSASVLAASGVGMKDMEPVLTSIAGAAAMTGRSYEDIGNIYSTVASNGKLMTMQLRQFSAAGLNVSAVLAKHFHKSEDEINKMVEKGEVSFKDFSEAMLTFGKQAKRANETFSGSLSNMKAGLSRIGALFYANDKDKGITGFLNHARDVFNAITPAIDEVASAILPFAQQVDRDLNSIKKSLVTFFEFLSGDTEKHIGPIKNLFTGLINIYNGFRRSVVPGFKAAFKEMFPDATLKTLGNLLRYFRILSTTIESKLLSQTDNFKDGFKGLFTIFKAAGNVLGFLKRILEAITAPFGGLINIIGTVIGTVGRAIQRFYDFVSGSELLANAADKIVQFVGKAAEALHNFISSSKTLKVVNGIISGIAKGLSLLGQGFTKLYESFKGSAMFEKITSGLNKIKDIFSNLGSGKGFKINFDSIFSGMFSGIESLGEKLKVITGAIAKLDFSKIFNTGLVALVSGSIIELTGAIDLLIDKLIVGKKTFLKLPTTLNSALIDLKTEWDKSLNVKRIKAKATAILIYAAAILILVHAVKTLGQLDTNQMISGIVAVGVLFKMLASGLDKLSMIDPKQAKGMTKTAVSMLILSFAIRSLSKAVETLGKIPIENLAKGLVSVGVILAALSLFLTKTDFKGFGVTKGLGLMAVASSLKIMSSAVSSLGSLNVKQLAKGLGGVAVLLTTISLALRLAGNPKRMISMGLGLVLMASSLQIFYSVVKKLGKMDPNKVGQGLLSLTAVLGILTATVNLMPGGKALAVGASLVIMSAGIAAISGSLKLLSTIPIAGIGTALAGIAGSLATFGLLAALVNPVKLLAASAAIVIFAAGIALLTPSLVAFGNLKLESIGKALLMLVGVLTVFGVAALVLTPVIPMMIALGIAIGLLGVGVTVTAAGLMLMATAFTMLAVSAAAGAAALVAAITAIVTGIITMIPEIGAALAEGIMSFIATIANSAADVANAAVKLGTALLDGIKTLAPKLVSTGLTLIMALLQGIYSNIQMFAAIGLGIIAKFILGLASGIGTLVQAGIALMFAFVNALAQGIRDSSEMVVAAAKNMMSAVVEAILSALQAVLQNIPVIGDNISDGLDKAKEKVREFFDVEEAEKMSADYMNGVSSGIDNNIGQLKNASGSAGEAVSNGTAAGFHMLDQESQNGMAGMATNIANGTPAVGAAASGVSDEVINNLKPSLEEAGMTGEQIDALMGQGMSNNLGPVRSGANKVTNAAAKEADKGAAKFGKAGKKANDSYNKSLSSGKKSSGAKKVVDSTVKGLESGNAKSKKAGEGLAKAFTGAVSKSAKSAKSAGSDVAKSGASGTANGDAKDSATTAGKNLGAGFIIGIQAKDKAAYDAGYHQGQLAAKGQKDGEKSSSPSKIAIQTGKYLGEGLVIGINSMTKSAYDAGYNMGDKASSALTDAMSMVYDMLNSDMNMNPTITPVLDLSNVSKGISNMDRLLNTRTMAASVSANMGSLRASSGGYLGSSVANSNNTSNTFNITVDGAENPEAFADRLVQQIQLRTRMI